MMSKAIVISLHARQQMRLRGAEEQEVLLAVQTGTWEPVKQGRLHARYVVSFNDVSPVNQKFYGLKTIDAVFVEEPDRIVVITVKVYYHD